MALRYTGSANEFYLPGNPKAYKNGDVVPISQQDALHMIEQSSLHSFELVKSGEDLEEKVTTPEPAFPSTPVVTEASKKDK